MERKQAQRAQVTDARRDVNLNGKNYVSQDEPLDPNIDESQVVRLTAKDYVEKQGRTHAFFSNFRPDYLFGQLDEKLKNYGQDYNVSNKNWKITFDVQKQINE